MQQLYQLFAGMAHPAIIFFKSLQDNLLCHWSNHGSRTSPGVIPEKMLPTVNGVNETKVNFP